MCLNHGVVYAYTMSCFNRREAHSGDHAAYSPVSRTDALQSLLSDDTHDSRAQHPYDWPEPGTPLHATYAMLRMP